MPDEPLFSSTEEIVHAYQHGGFKGYVPNQREKDEFLETNPVRAFSSPASGKGKRALLWAYVLKLDPAAFTERQTEGDCFPAGTLVRMADGTETPIEDVREGDLVASPFGGKRRVVSTLEKQYQGDVVTVRAEGCADSITATPDHRFVSHVNKYEWAWKEVGSFSLGDRVLLPYTDIFRWSHHVYDLACEEGCGEEKERRKKAACGAVRTKCSRVDTKRLISLCPDVAWLIGLWLAEGSAERSSSGKHCALTWSLCEDELHLARRVKSVAKQFFGLNARIYTIPSKPSCLFVRVGSAPMARWMYRICGEQNTYGKRVPKEVLTSNYDVRMSCLRGWMDGDGCVSSGPRSDRPQYLSCKATGVSVSRGLVRDMKYLATSCRVMCSDTIRKPRGRSKEASDLHFYGENAVAVFPGKCKAAVGTRKSSVWRADDGFAPRIKSIERASFDGKVYCIGVEEDHAFIANGYAVHNCVSHGSRNCRDSSRATSILVKGQPFDWFKRTATEPTYGSRGHGGSGMSPAGASRFERDCGFVPRENYPGVADFSVYNGSLGAKWGSTGVPQAVQKLCNRNKVGTIALVRTMDDAMDALFNGYGIHSGQNAAWSDTPGSKNIHPRVSPGWAHDMATVGYDDTKEFWPFRVWFIANSWGRWNKPVKDWPASYPVQVPGMIVTDDAGYATCIESEDAWTYSDVQGFPAQTLPDLGSLGRI